jgi:group I intron endonuclease
MIIYRITNNITNLSYIGKTMYTLNKRWKEHCKKAKYGSDSHFHRAIKKYPKNSWILEIIDEATNDLVDYHEIYWIAFYNTYFNGYNSTCGGGSGKMCDEAKQKISKIHKGKTISEKQKLLSSIANAGSNNYWFGTKGPMYGKRGKDNPSFGLHPSEKARKQMGLSRTGEKNCAYGKIWINDGIKNKRIIKEDLDKFLNEGFKKGILN